MVEEKDRGFMHGSPRQQKAYGTRTPQEDRLRVHIN